MSQSSTSRIAACLDEFQALQCYKAIEKINLMNMKEHPDKMEMVLYLCENPKIQLKKKPTTGQPAASASSRKLKYQSQRSRRNDDFSSSAKTEDQSSRKILYQSTGLQRNEKPDVALQRLIQTRRKEE
ncbi:hypothetical protein F511_31526 [Dorcoceras hygrometricum]|uniref:Uncharacterized protein n=1 Tax=Dorcoceras hygrometricum TaxID=472368 RepID=A0A2Z7B2Q0_9LAMI|nr:hypothetical protein F511_31526 [Dorcoceras hygrometricum]